jgi:membrane-bound lytic murein transglycosylase D
MKTMDVNIANVERMVSASGNAQGADEIARLRSQRQNLDDGYNHLLASLKVYDPKMSEQQKLVLRVARIFGECEVAMPPEFLNEIQNYINKWKSSGRYLRAVNLAREKGYTQTIAHDFLSEGLPPQFFYLGMQESDFQEMISGPPTHAGIAKGMWQFIPSTGEKYGLKIGPLVDLARPDPADDRHHWDRETKAAASYIKDLYSTDAQASGLLVMACYNWGEGSVLPLVQSMPKNPRERNFWKLLELHRDKVPQETYDYVFYIVSAAVIGENPRLFGMDCENPLAGI